MLHLNDLPSWPRRGSFSKLDFRERRDEAMMAPSARQTSTIENAEAQRTVFHVALAIWTSELRHGALKRVGENPRWNVMRLAALLLRSDASIQASPCTGLHNPREKTPGLAQKQFMRR
jgi:hypothetical protein